MTKFLSFFKKFGLMTGYIYSKMQKKIHPAQYAFYYLTSFFSLGLVSIGIGILLFQIINFYFPDTNLDFYDPMYHLQGIKMGIAFLVVSSPLFFVISVIIYKSIQQKKLSVESNLRKWLIYIALFFTTIVAVIDLIVVLFGFLDGEITARFLLKAFVIFSLSGAIFFYFFQQSQIAEKKRPFQNQKIWAIIFWCFVLIPFVWSLFFLESPQKTGERKADHHFAFSLDSLTHEISEYYREEERLPKTLEDAYRYNYREQEDIEREVGYVIIGEKSFELCAEFLIDTSSYRNSFTPYHIHTKGKNCFSVDLKEEKGGYISQRVKNKNQEK